MWRYLSFIIFCFSFSPVVAQIAEHPCDPEANEATCELYRYLRDEVWGKQVIAGCNAEWNYNTNDAERIYKTGGQHPAVNVFDFQHFDQSWINYKADIAKNWHEAGGIVSFMWHIHMPANAFAQQKEGWDTFYTGGNPPCHIRPTACVTEGTLENHLFRTRLEGVAELLLYYQSQGIPILWRPLHEASGKWFWWGAEDAASYKRLWIYMFDYFREAGIHNLLWLWTSEVNDRQWYPGDAYVDIVARDGYPQNNNSHQSQVADFRKLRQAYPSKMIALPETNSVPSWQNMQRDGALWLFVAPWCGDTPFSYGNTNDFWQEFLAEENIITREKRKQSM